jgi:hypothetical protein
MGEIVRSKLLLLALAYVSANAVALSRADGLNLSSQRVLKELRSFGFCTWHPAMLSSKWCWRLDLSRVERPNLFGTRSEAGEFVHVRLLPSVLSDISAVVSESLAILSAR